MRAKDLRAQNRKMTRRRKREPCLVCGKHRYITQLHHVVSFNDCVTVLKNQEEWQTALVWLCPNCHAYIHQLARGLFFPAMGEVSEEELDRLYSIMNLHYNLMFPGMDIDFPKRRKGSEKTLDCEKGDV